MLWGRIQFIAGLLFNYGAQPSVRDPWESGEIRDPWESDVFSSMFPLNNVFVMSRSSFYYKVNPLVKRLAVCSEQVFLQSRKLLCFCPDLTKLIVPTTFMFWVSFSSSLRMPQQNSTKMDFPSGLCHRNGLQLLLLSPSFYNLKLFSTCFYKLKLF